jgi:hypothetical protein
MPKTARSPTAPHCLAGRNRYCGPAVVGMLTGTDSDAAATAIRSVSGQRAVRGSSRSAVRGALAAKGLTMTARTVAGVSSTPRKSTLTLAGWQRCEARDKTNATTYLLVAGNHWLVTRGRSYFCGLVRQWVPLSEAPRRRARVTDVYVIAGPMAKAFPTIGEAAAKRAARTPRAPRQTLAQYAARWGIEVERSTGWLGYNVWPPGAIDDTPEADPSYDDHFCDDIQQARALVEVYIALLTQMGHSPK